MKGGIKGETLGKLNSIINKNTLKNKINKHFKFSFAHCKHIYRYVYTCRLFQAMVYPSFLSIYDDRHILLQTLLEAEFKYFDLFLFNNFKNLN